MGRHYDVLVIGSGFGGSVAALRLSEKGYRVGVLEAGRRYADAELPKTSWELRKFLWAPAIGLLGIQRIHLLRNVAILAGAGVGGGSLVYAGTLYEPPDAFYQDPQWSGITDWRAELAPYYARAKRMLGVNINPTMTPSDEVLKAVAEEMGAGATFHRTPVGIFFGPPGKQVPDPYFGGAGPDRRGCIECGECMTGCRHGAKNKLTVNYLYFAEKSGADIHPLRTVTQIRPTGNGYRVDTVRSGSAFTPKSRESFTAEQVVLAAGTYGTQLLLHRMVANGNLPGISPVLGRLTRTNSESLAGSTARHPRADYSRGVAITSSFHPDPDTHVEPVRYGKGSNAMGLLATLQTDGRGPFPRWLKWCGQAIGHPLRLGRSLDLRHWSERTIIALTMQSLDNSITIIRRRRRIRGGIGLTSRQGHGRPNPTWLPVANDVARRVARHIGGDPGGTVSEIANVPMTAHFIGGCPIGDSPETGVVDPYHRLYGHPGVHVVDGSTICANLGVNPSLTITAQAERALTFWPNRGDDDPRPDVGAPYRRIHPVVPVNPAFPQ